MKKTIAIISYVIFLPCLIIGCMLFYSYMEKFPFVNNPSPKDERSFYKHVQQSLATA